MPEQLHFLTDNGEHIQLNFDKHIFFGRAEGNTIVVKDLRASRQHAELYWDGSSFVLIDLNSSNGTFVGEERVSTHVMKSGEAIQIGMASYLYRIVSSREELDSKDLLAKSTGAMVTAEMPNFANMIQQTDFNGTLTSMGVADICQMLGLGMRNGMLLIQNEKHEKGILYFKQGQIVGAECRMLTGNEAVIHILKFRNGTFSFRNNHPVAMTNVTKKTESLLLESARQGDESTR
jgi:pSer/pThr/pTyr-binding forkhead associated (FHA) protein